MGKNDPLDGGGGQLQLLLALPQHLTVQHLFPFLTVREACLTMRTCKQLRTTLQASLEGWFETATASRVRPGMRSDAVQFRALLRRMKRVSRLKLDQTCALAVGDCAQRVGVRLRVLEAVNGPHITDSVLFEVGRTCLGLERLVLSAAKVDVTDWGVRCLANSACRLSLQLVSISGAHDVTDATILLERCPKLRELHFPHCAGVKRIAIGHQADDGEDDAAPVQKLLTLLPSPLVSLDLCFNIQLQITGALPAQRLANLLSINLSGCALINDTALGLIAHACPLLVAVNVSFCTKITDFGLKTLAAGLKSTTSATMAATTRLERFACARCVGVGDAGLIALCATPTLIELDCQNCHRVTDLLLTRLGQHCPALRSLSLRGMDFVSDAGVAALLVQGVALQHLSLAACPRVSDASLFAIAANSSSSSSQLSSLDLFCASRITDAGLSRLVSSCVRLCKLNVSWCFQLSTDLVFALEHSLQFCCNGSGSSNSRGLVHEGLDTTDAAAAARNQRRPAATLTLTLEQQQPAAAARPRRASLLNKAPPSRTPPPPPLMASSSACSATRTRRGRHRRHRSEQQLHSRGERVPESQLGFLSFVRTPPPPPPVVSVGGLDDDMGYGTDAMEEEEEFALPQSWLANSHRRPRHRHEDKPSPRLLPASRRRVYGDDAKDLEREAAFATATPTSYPFSLDQF